MTQDLTNAWMATHTGGRFWPTQPEPMLVEPRDIARSLSMLCRYGGHVERFYSVAEHCVLMSRAVPEEDALWALLHDATEAYVGDMVRPLKHQLPAFSELEGQVMAAVALRFGLQTEWGVPAGGADHGRFMEPVMPASVRDADNRIILDEKRAVLRPQKHRWAADDLEPLGVEIRAWRPSRAEYAYLERLDELGVEIR